jgi:hypothetical protein
MAIRNSLKARVVGIGFAEGLSGGAEVEDVEMKV